MSTVFVTGMGVISALGHDVESNLNALKLAKTGIKKAEFLNSSYTKMLPFGEVPSHNDSLSSMINSKKEDHLNRTDLLAQIAFEEAIKHAGLNSDDLKSTRTGFISSSTVNGMCNTDELYLDSKKESNPSVYIDSYSNNAHVLKIKKKYHLKGYSSCINTACSSAANAVLFGTKLIKAGKLDRVIVGGVDPLSKFTTNGFNALMILSDEDCKPFDINRKGLNLGEGAGYLVLEKDTVCEGKTKYAKVLGYGNSNDAFHPSATSDEGYGPILSMTEALKTANLESSDIDYINAHGTGTPNNDQTELVAFKTLFKDIPEYSSTKSYTGHTLAASGAIESIFSILSLQHNILFPSLNCSEPIGSGKDAPLNKVVSKEVNYVMSNSFGFGGNCTSLIFSKPCI